MPYFRAHLAGRVDEGVLREMTDGSGDALSGATANANANTEPPRRDREARGKRRRRGCATEPNGARRRRAAKPPTKVSLEKKKCSPRRVDGPLRREIFGVSWRTRLRNAKGRLFKKSGLGYPGYPESGGSDRSRLRARFGGVRVPRHARARRVVPRVARVGAPGGARAAPRGGRREPRRQDAGPPRGARLGGDTRARGRGRSTGRPRDAPSLAVSALPSRLYALKLRASYVGTGEGTGEEKAEAFGDFGDRDPPGPKTKTIRLSRCVSCARVFPTNAVPFLSCARAERASVAFDGRVVARHVPAPRFDAAAFLDVLLEAHDPRHVYWYLWGATRVLPACERCGARGVAAAELDACRYHPREAVFDVHERDEGEENDFHETATTTNDDDDGSSRTRGLNAVGVWPAAARGGRGSTPRTRWLSAGAACASTSSNARVEF